MVDVMVAFEIERENMTGGEAAILDLFIRKKMRCSGWFFATLTHVAFTYASMPSILFPLFHFFLTGQCKREVLSRSYGIFPALFFPLLFVLVPFLSTPDPLSNEQVAVTLF